MMGVGTINVVEGLKRSFHVIDKNSLLNPASTDLSSEKLVGRQWQVWGRHY